MTVKVEKCKCEHSFQDKEYGKKMRVYNTSEDGKKLKCTVCGNVIRK